MDQFATGRGHGMPGGATGRKVRSARRRLVRDCTVGAILLGAASPGAAAADLETLVVTGSRIARHDVESASPLVSLPAEAFKQTAAVSLERTLNQLPQFVAASTGASNNPSSDGQATVSLRGLGPARTLVLLDGRRMVAADGNGSVDLNVLPGTLVQSVEVVTGGASAVYGSEAIAGVVNVRLTESFDGVALDGSGSVTDRGDGEEYSAGVTAGTSFAAGRGSVLGFVGYAERSQVGQDARGFSEYPLLYVAGVADGRGPGGAFVGSGSGIVEEGLSIVFADPAVFRDLFAGYGYPPGSVPYQAGFVANADGSVFTIGTSAPGSVANFRGDPDPVLFNDRAYNAYNFAPETALQMPLERTTALLRGSYDINDGLELYLQALYTQYSVSRQLGAAAAGIALIPPDNPFVPADLKTLLASRASPSAPFRYWRRTSEVGPQSAENERDVLQTTVGARGDLAGGWQFDVYAQFGENERTEHQTSNVRLSRLQELTFAPDGGRSRCEGGFDPFHAGSLSADCARYIAVDATNRITVRQTIAEASVDGPLLELPAGAARLAIGLFYKRDEFNYDASPALSAMLPGVPGVIGPRPDIAGFPAAPDRSGTESNADAYVELRLPVLHSRPGVESLDVGLGYRRSDYSQAGAADSYKAELLYRPVSPLRVRGSFQHAVRAPSIEQLYYPPVQSQFLVPMPDPCSASSAQRRGPGAAQVEALCLAQGLPAALLPDYEFTLRRADGESGGNPDLEPEQADTYTLGFVVTPGSGGSGWGDLQVAVDWYRITVEDGIGRWDSESAVQRCYDPTFNPAYEAQNVYCTFFTRNADNGNIYALILDRNIGGIETSGVDVQADWSVEAGPGDVRLNAYLTYVDTWQYLDPSGGKIQFAGTVGGGGLGTTLPRWKSLVNLEYAWQGIGCYLRWQHLDGARDVKYRDFEVPAYDYFDLGASYTVAAGALAGLTARAGIDNVFDDAPPIFPTWQQANTDPSQYDVLGRRYYLRLQYRF